MESKRPLALSSHSHFTRCGHTSGDKTVISDELQILYEQSRRCRMNLLIYKLGNCSVKVGDLKLLFSILPHLARQSGRWIQHNFHKPSHLKSQVCWYIRLGGYAVVINYSCISRSMPTCARHSFSEGTINRRKRGEREGERGAQFNYRQRTNEEEQIVTLLFLHYCSTPLSLSLSDSLTTTHQIHRTLQTHVLRRFVYIGCVNPPPGSL